MMFQWPAINSRAHFLFGHKNHLPYENHLIVLAHKGHESSVPLFFGQLKIPGDLPHQLTTEAKSFGNFSASIIR